MDAAARGEVYDVTRPRTSRAPGGRASAPTRRRRRWSRRRRRRAQPDARLERAARRADHAGVRTARRDAAHRGEEVLRTRRRRPGPQRRRLGAGAAGRRCAGGRRRDLRRDRVVADAAHPRHGRGDRRGARARRRRSRTASARRPSASGTATRSTEVEERWPDQLESWLSSFDYAPPGGESIDEVQARVEAALRQTLDDVRRPDGRRGQPRQPDQAVACATASTRRWRSSTRCCWRPPRSRRCRSTSRALSALRQFSAIP